MGKKLSVCEEHGYTKQCNTEDGTVATSKEGKEVVIKEIKKPYQEMSSEVDKLKATIHPHIVGYNSFEVEDCLYVVMDHCKGGNLAQKIQEQRESGAGFEEDQILQWIVQTCMALECIHENGLLHKDLKPERILLTESGTVCLGGFGNLSERMHGKTISAQNAAICSASPEMSTYGTKSDIWALGCVLYELCTLELAFATETEINQRAGDEYPTLPGHFSKPLQQLLNDIFQGDPGSRPTARAILTRPFIINFLISKSKATIEELQANLGLLASLADGLEKAHESTTIISLMGNITATVGSLTSIVGLSLALTTFGLSLIITGVGVMVSVAGGATASISNITNKVKKNSVHRAIESVIKEFTEKLNSVVTSLAHISQGSGQLPEIPVFPNSEGRKNVREMAKKVAKIGAEAVNCLGGIPQLVDLIEAGGTAAEIANVVQAVDVATGVLSSLAVAVDVFFIAKDAKEIHDIRQAQAQAAAGEGSVSEDEMLIDADPESANIKSKTMKFVLLIRQKAKELQEIVDQLKETVDGCFRSIIYNENVP